MLKINCKRMVLFLIVSLFLVSALPAFAQTDDIIETNEPQATIDYQLDLSVWYQIAADTIGVDVAELMESEETIKAVAQDNGSTARSVIKAIFAAEKAELKALQNDGQLTTAEYRARRNEVKSEIQAFVRTDSYDPYTVPTIQEERWSELGLDSYTYFVQKFCFCLPSYGHTVTVVDGEVVSVTTFDPSISTATIEPDGTITVVEGETIDVDPTGFLTMDEWFTYIMERQANTPYYLSAKFDPTLGYPTSSYIDYDSRIADDEIGYSITLIQE